MFEYFYFQPNFFNIFLKKKSSRWKSTNCMVIFLQVFSKSTIFCPFILTLRGEKGEKIQNSLRKL